MKEFLDKQDYNTTDPFVKQAINQQIIKGMKDQPAQQDTKLKSKLKDFRNRALSDLLPTGNNLFKNLSERNPMDIEIDYQEEQNRWKKEIIEQVFPQRFTKIGDVNDRTSKTKKKPIFKMTDLYITFNTKINRLIDKVFQNNIYGKSQQKKQSKVIQTKIALNPHRLQQILKEYQDAQDFDGMDKQQTKWGQQDLQQYVIDMGESKEDYFLFYKHQNARREMDVANLKVKNNPCSSSNFLESFHRQVYAMERRSNFRGVLDHGELKSYHVGDQEKVKSTMVQEKMERARSPEKQSSKHELQDKPSKKQKVKSYFGQFNFPQKRQKKEPKLYKQKDLSTPGSFKIDDKFTPSALHQQKSLSTKIKEYYSYVDKDIINQNFKQPLEQNDRLEINLANPYFFNTKIHTVFGKGSEMFKERQYNKMIEIKNTNNMSNGGGTVVSGDDLTSRVKMGRNISVIDSQIRDFNPHLEEQHQTIQKVIEIEIKNSYKQPIKHSEIANRFDFVKFTFDPQSFKHYHRHFFPFQEHLNGRVSIEIVQHRPRRLKPNGLVINTQMKQSNQKLTKRQDFSLSRGEFILIEYLQQTPLLMSNIGMCQRMFIQVNYPQLLQKVNSDFIMNKSIDEVEKEREQPGYNYEMSDFQKHCEIWRKNIREIFGENGKQLYWEPKNQGKLIGAPEGSGVIVMQSNLCNVPLVKKKKNPRDFLLVRQGKKWFLRRIDHLYVSGQVEPHKKVFCPGSRQHTQFKMAYQKAFIINTIHEQGKIAVDYLKSHFRQQTEASLKKALKSCGAISRDTKIYKFDENKSVSLSDSELTPQDICLYERMQKSQCDLFDVGIKNIKINQKMKNVLKEFYKKNYQSLEKFTLARVIREQLQLTSWYLTDSFLKYKQKASKIEINGFADPTNGKGGFSFINKPQKQRTAKEDMQEKISKQKQISSNADLRKLNCQESREKLVSMGFDANEVDEMGRWKLIDLLKKEDGTEFSRRQRQTKNKKVENEKKQINKNFNRLLMYLNGETEMPAFDYKHIIKNDLDFYMQRESKLWEKVRSKFERYEKASQTIKAEVASDESEDEY